MKFFKKNKRKVFFVNCNSEMDIWIDIWPICIMTMKTYHEVLKIKFL